MRPKLYNVTKKRSELPGQRMPSERIEAIVGKNAADHLLSTHVPEELRPCSPEANVVPLQSAFARALLARIGLAQARVSSESAHLDPVESAASEYLPRDYPPMRLLK